MVSSRTGKGSRTDHGRPSVIQAITVVQKFDFEPLCTIMELLSFTHLIIPVHTGRKTRILCHSLSIPIDV